MTRAGFDPRKADLLHRLNLVGQDIAGRPDLGPYEVGVLQHLNELAAQISGLAEDRPRYQYHHGSGRAIDLPLPDPFKEWLKRHTTGRS